MQLAAIVLAAGLMTGLNADKDAPRLMGVHLEMSKTGVHAALSRTATFKSEDENQEVWLLKSDTSVRSVIVGYAPDNHVRYITAFARAGGKALACAPLGNIRNAKVAGAQGDYVYSRSWKEHGDEFLATARGSVGHLTMCSVKKVGVGIENEEEEHEAHKTPR